MISPTETCPVRTKKLMSGNIPSLYVRFNAVEPTGTSAEGTAQSDSETTSAAISSEFN